MTQPPDPEQPHGDPIPGPGDADQPPPPPPPPPVGGEAPPPPGGQAPYTQPGYEQPGYAQPGAAAAAGAYNPAPYGIHPATGLPYSDKSKVVAGILQILLPFGIGRFYIGDNNIGIAQLVVTLVTCGIGGLWSVVDGVLILVNDSKDAQGRILRS